MSFPVRLQSFGATPLAGTRRGRSARAPRSISRGPGAPETPPTWWWSRESFTYASTRLQPVCILVRWLAPLVAPPPSSTGWGNVRGKSDKKLGDYGGAISDGKAGNARFWRGVLAHSGEFWHVPIIFGLVLYSFYVVLLRNLWHTFEIENWSNGVSVRKSGSHYSLSILSCHI